MTALRVLKVTAYDCKCERCGHKWRALELPERCAHCKRKYWNAKPGTLPRGRPRNCMGSGAGLIPGDLVTTNHALCRYCGKKVRIARGSYVRHVPKRED